MKNLRRFVDYTRPVGDDIHSPIMIYSTSEDGDHYSEVICELCSASLDAVMFAHPSIDRDGRAYSESWCGANAAPYVIRRNN